MASAPDCRSRRTWALKASCRLTSPGVADCRNFETEALEDALKKRDVIMGMRPRSCSSDCRSGARCVLGQRSRCCGQNQEDQREHHPCKALHIPVKSGGSMRLLPNFAEIIPIASGGCGSNARRSVP